MTAVLVAGAVQLVGLSGVARADDVTWTGGANGSSLTWLTAANWSTSTVPTNTDTAIFSSGGTNTGDITIQMATALGVQPVGAIKLDAGNTLNRTIRNNSATSNGVLVVHGVAGVLLNNESSSRLRLTNGVSRLMDVGLAGSGEIYTGNDPSSTVPSIDMYSSMVDFGGPNGFTKTGPGTLYLRSANTFSGPVTNQSGQLKFNANGTVGDGTGTLYLNGGYLVSASSRLGSPIWNPIVLLADANIYPDSGLAGINNQRYFPLGGTITGTSGSLIIGNQSTTADNTFVVRLLAGGYTLSRPISLGSIADTPGAFKVVDFANGPTNGVLTVDSLITGDGSVRRDGDVNGVTLLTADNTYSGGTSVRSGHLFANNTTGSALGSGAVTVTNAGKLGGTGSIDGPTTFDLGGTLSPGSTTNTIGNLTFTTDLNLSAGAKFTVHINAATGTAGVNWDVVTVNGTWTDAATTLDPIVVSLDSLGVPPTGWNSGIGRTWKIIDGGIASGFDATHFAADDSAFAGAIQGVWSFSVVSGDLFLTYTPAADIVINVAAGSVNQGATTPTPYPFLTGTFGVLKVGDGEVVFTNAANDYAGSTKIYAGTGSISVDAFNGSGALGAASSPILLGNTLGTSNATLNITTDGVTNGRAITVQAGSTGAKTIGTSLTSGTANYTGDISLLDDVTLSAATGGTAIVGGVISGAGNVTKTNGGTVALAAANTYTGKTRILGGTLSIDAVNRLGAAPAELVEDQILLDGGTLEYTGVNVTSVGERGFTFGAGGATIALVSSNLSLSGLVTGPGGLVKTGVGRFGLNNPTNNYAGDTIVNDGEIGLDGDGQFGAGTVYLNGGGIAITANRATTVANYIPNAIVVNGDVTIRSSDGTANTSRIAVFNGTNWSAVSGSLTFSNSATANTNTFDVRHYGGGFNFTAPVILDNGTGQGSLTRLLLGNSNASSPQTFSGVISGNGRIRRSAQVSSDAGVTIFTAANTYSGNTEVAAGTLLVNNTVGSGTGSGTVTLTSPGVLGGTGAIAGAVSGNGTISPGTSAGTLSLSGGLDLSSGGTYRWELAALATNNPGVNYDTIAMFGGDLVLGGTSNLELVFTNAATDPDSGNPFWNESRQWTIATIAGAANNPGPTAFTTLSNATFTAGYFTNYADGGGNIVLEFVSTGAPSLPPPPVISPVIAGAGTASATISFSSTNGASYTVEGKTNLLQPTWNFLGTVNAVGATSSFIDTNGPFKERYYRVTSP